MATQILVNIGSGNGSLPDGTKPLPEPMLTYLLLNPMKFIWGHYHKKIWRYQWKKKIEDSTFKIKSRYPRVNELMKYLMRYNLPFRRLLNMRGPSYLGLTRSILWLLMPWLLVSPGHQQSWYWLYRISRSLSYLRKDFNYLYNTNEEDWHKM